MKTEALGKYDTPNYPKKEEVQAQPSLFRKTVFKRWQKLFDLGISGMLVAGLSLTGCDDDSPSNTSTSVINSHITENQSPESSTAKTTNIEKVAALVAPIFGHGEGRGAIGCEVIAPPAFLSEAEAMIIIKEELVKHGVNIDKEKIVLNDVQITQSNNESASQQALKEEKTQPLEIDFADSDNGIHIEYISEEDYQKFREPQQMFLSIEFIDIKQVAINVRNKLQVDTKRDVYGVFYDPVTNIEFDYFSSQEDTPYQDRWEYARIKAVNSSKELLRKQVSDFAAWLKEQDEI